jgi:PEP-CTERM motif
VSGTDGVVSLAPLVGSTAYGWVSTTDSTAKAGYSLGDETNGSSIRSVSFSAAAGDVLKFYFNYVTSDGAEFTDYGYANLLKAADSSIAAVLFNARTQASGTIAPGFGLPVPVATLTPSSVPIIPGGPSWSRLGADSGSCYDAGCGYTGWIQSTYAIAAAGTYVLEFGVTNWLDPDYQSGLAFDGITVAGAPIPPAVPEPGTYALMLGGLLVCGAAARWRSRA